MIAAMLPNQPSTAELNGWTILSLRPSGEHAPVRRAAARRGARVIACSPLALRPLRAGDALARALNADRVVFSSPAAVRFASMQQPLALAATQRALAVGAGTAAALARHGIVAIYPRTQMTSEGLLALPPLQQIARLSVGLITAPGGRGVLAAQLAQRARHLHVAEVYERVPHPIRAATWRKLAQLATPLALLASSGEALHAFAQQCPAPVRNALAQALAVVASERLGQQARAQGFANLIVAASARPSAMLAALAEFHRESRFR